MPHTIQIKRRKDSNTDINTIPIKDGELLFDEVDENKLKIGVGTEGSASVEDINIGGAIKNDGCFVGLDETNSTLIKNYNNTTDPCEIDITVDTAHNGNINIESAGTGTGVISISATKEGANSGVNIESKSVKLISKSVELIGTGKNAVVESKKVNEVSGGEPSNAPFVLVAPVVKHTTALSKTAKTIIDTDGNVMADKDGNGDVISSTYAKNDNITGGSIKAKYAENADNATNDANGTNIATSLSTINTNISNHSTDINRVEGKINGVINGDTTVPKATNARYAEYTDSSHTSKTIEQRLTELGFNDASGNLGLSSGFTGDKKMCRQGKVYYIYFSIDLNGKEVPSGTTDCQLCSFANYDFATAFMPGYSVGQIREFERNYCLKINGDLKLIDRIYMEKRGPNIVDIYMHYNTSQIVKQKLTGKVTFEYTTGFLG